MKHPLFSAKGRRTWLWSHRRRRNRFIGLAVLAVVACAAGMVALRVATTPPASSREAVGAGGVMGGATLAFPTMQPLPVTTPLSTPAAATPSGAATDSGVDSDAHAETTGPDPVGFAVSAVTSWLAGAGQVPLPADAPAPLPGATVPGPGELVSSGDTFAAVSVPLALADGTTSSAFVVLSLSEQGAGQWSVAQLVVGV